MNISELIQKLSEIKAREGDLPCVVTVTAQDEDHEVRITEVIIRPGDDIDIREPSVFIR